MKIQSLAWHNCVCNLCEYSALFRREWCHGTLDYWLEMVLRTSRYPVLVTTSGYMTAFRCHVHVQNLFETIIVRVSQNKHQYQDSKLAFTLISVIYATSTDSVHPYMHDWYRLFEGNNSRIFMLIWYNNSTFYFANVNFSTETATVFLNTRWESGFDVCQCNNL